MCVRLAYAENGRRQSIKYQYCSTIENNSSVIGVDSCKSQTLPRVIAALILNQSFVTGNLVSDALMTKLTGLPVLL